MNEIYLYDNKNEEIPLLNVWCAFPAVYNFGMSALGFLTVFKMIDETQGILAEKIFTDTKTTYLQYKNVDLITFAFSFELDYTGILEILDKYNIPLNNKERNENHPLIMGGGAVLSANPEPFADFFDFIMIGDAEPHIKEILSILKDNKCKTKTEKLQMLSLIEGIYIPSMKNESYKVKKVTSELQTCTSTPILTEGSFFPNTYIIEIERGCPQNCRFCLTSYLNTPVRFCTYEQIIEKIEEGLKYTNKIAFLGALICSHPKIDEICEYIIKKVKNGRQLEVSVSSLRADYVSDKTLEMLNLCGQKTATIALEAGSERLRNVINKRLKKDDILKLADKMVKYGFVGLKIYGIVGLPTETYEDLDEFIALCREIKSKYKGFNIIPSFSTFVPKAHTPFQFAKREEEKKLEKKNEYLKKEFAKIGIKARTSSAKWDSIQALLSRGSRDLMPYLIDVYKLGANLGNFKSVYKEYEQRKILPAIENFTINEQNINKKFPWDFIIYPKSRTMLEKEYQEAIAGNF